MATMTIAEALGHAAGFPLTPGRTAIICAGRDLVPEEDYTLSKRRSFELAVADAFRLAVTMPDVTEGGVSIKMPDEKTLVAAANGIYSRWGEPLLRASSEATVRPIEL